MADIDVVAREVMVVNTEGFHARPVMKFVDVARQFRAAITVTNISRGQEQLDGKSAMQLMLLDAPKGSRLRIRATGDDAVSAVPALVGLVERGFSDSSA